jgi:hypothetical protein
MLSKISLNHCCLTLHDPPVIDVILDYVKLSVSNALSKITSTGGS